MKKIRVTIARPNAQRKREALIAAGVAPSQFGRRAAARGERKHK